MSRYIGRTPYIRIRRTDEEEKMGEFTVFIVVAALFAVLFAAAKGGFRSAADLILRKMPTLSQYASPKAVSTALIIIFVANALGALMQYQAISEDTAARGYLVRGSYGEADETAELRYEVGGVSEDIDLTVRSRTMSDEEIGAALQEAAGALPELIFGETDPSHTDTDISLPEKIAGSPVIISWMTDRPDIIGIDGELSDSVPEEGEEVTLFAEISCGEEVLESEYELRAFPRAEGDEARRSKAVMRAVEDRNDASDEKLILPDTLDGRSVSWSKRRGNSGAALLLMGLMTAAVFVYRGVRLKEIEEEKRVSSMKNDYPGIVSKLLLLISAGMSIRSALDRIRSDYARSLKGGGRIRAGYEEIARTALDMRNGSSEIEAYENLGKRCGSREYRTFASMLAAGTVRGGSELSAMLKNEARAAYEERKKRARVLGEEAGTKLLLPMMLMLSVVMAILMVPAFITFI